MHMHAHAGASQATTQEENGRRRKSAVTLNFEVDFLTKLGWGTRGNSHSYPLIASVVSNFCAVFAVLFLSIFFVFVMWDVLYRGPFLSEDP